MTSTDTESPDARPLRIGVSSCVIGEEVRWNGGHSRQRYLTDMLGPFVEYVPVCPEVEVGMGVPRPTVRLVREGETIRMIDPKNEVDWTSSMNRLSLSRASDLAGEDLSGFVLKKDSPTCGVFRVRIYTDTGVERNGRGLFADALIQRMPYLPIEEEGRLNDARIRENFVERIFAYQRVKDLFRPRWTVGDVVAFHTREKLLLRAHDERGYRELGKLVAEAKSVPRAAFADDYADRFMEIMKRPATVAKHVNVLQHMLAFLRWDDDEVGRAEMREAIADYKAGLVPLVVPVTLIRHLANRHERQILLDSSYLSPHPKELMLRNHV
jgi:uncharacterized protein YbgA (DUF1722 family)/uncharacterized protein YbbK (DUF523 family)